MEPIDRERIEIKALNSIWKFERLVWGAALKRGIRNEHSRFYRNVPKHGVSRAAVMFVGNLWLLPALFFGVVSVALAFRFGYGTHLPRTFAFLDAGFFLFAMLRVSIHRQ